MAKVYVKVNGYVKGELMGTYKSVRGRKVIEMVRVKWTKYTVSSPFYNMIMFEKEFPRSKCTFIYPDNWIKRLLRALKISRRKISD